MEKIITFLRQKWDFKVCVIWYEGCSNMNASSFITWLTYMLRQNAIPFWKELLVAFKMASKIRKHSLYFSSYRRLYKGHSCILKYFWSELQYTFGTCAYIVPYLCKFETKWHQILDAGLRYIDKVACRKKFIWASSRENLSSEVYEQQRRRPACASAQSDQRLCYSLNGKYNISTCYKRKFQFSS